MKNRPILFSAPMVRAILEGRKTQTRRVINPQPIDIDGCPWVPSGWAHWETDDKGLRGCTCKEIKCPFGQPGDALWVRETFSNSEPIYYRATLPNYLKDSDYIWKPSIFMPRWASRITLQIADIRVERVQEISEEDAHTEGVWNGWTAAFDPNDPEPMKRKFKELWNSINVPRGFGWDINPWVWVIAFAVVEYE
jgi:hypothetical protein